MQRYKKTCYKKVNSLLETRYKKVRNTIRGN